MVKPCFLYLGPRICFFLATFVDHSFLPMTQKPPLKTHTMKNSGRLLELCSTILVQTYVRKLKIELYIYILYLYTYIYI